MSFGQYFPYFNAVRMARFDRVLKSWRKATQPGSSVVGCALALSMACIPMALAVQAEPPAYDADDAASEIIRLERAALDRSDRGDIEGFLELSDAEVSYFDPFLERPIYGLDALRSYYRQFTAGEKSSGEMSNIKVRMLGDSAVLTFNYVSTKMETRRVTRWNTTEVYQRTPEGWRIVHTHWSLLQPKLAQAQ